MALIMVFHFTITFSWNVGKSLPLYAGANWECTTIYIDFVILYNPYTTETKPKSIPTQFKDLPPQAIKTKEFHFPSCQFILKLTEW